MTVIRKFRINRPSVSSEVFDDEVVVINLKTGFYYSSARAGAAIWSALDDGFSVREIVDALSAVSGDSTVDVEGMVETFVSQLVEEGLIVQDKSDSGAIGDTIRLGEDYVLEPPVLQKYTDMEELLLLDPIHDVDEAGWPVTKPEDQPGA
jgi:hypothetical protein